MRRRKRGDDRLKLTRKKMEEKEGMGGWRVGGEEELEDAYGEQIIRNEKRRR